MLNDYALIIGIQDYGAYDRSMDLPAGTSDVPGAVSDARAHYRQCIAMGFAPERIRVLTAPRLAPQDLGPEATADTVGDATHAGLIAGLEWLVASIAPSAPAASSAPADATVAAGLLTFSGHGAWSHGVALCPADVTGSPTGSIDQVIRVADVRRALGRGEVADNLTMLLDCCRGQVGLSRKESLLLRLRAWEAGAEPAHAGVAERVIAACARDQVSASSLFGGEEMGAFTWAITAAMGQWRVVREHGVGRLSVSYGELTRRTRGLLAALSFAQEPALAGPPGVAALPFLHPGSEAHAGETSAQPDRARTRRQLDGGQYKIRWKHDDEDYRTLARVNVTGNSSVTLPANNGASYTLAADTEYWSVRTEVAGAMKSSRKGALRVYAVDRDEIDVTSNFTQMFEATSRFPAGGWQRVAANQLWPANTVVFQQKKSHGVPPDYYVCIQVEEQTANGITAYGFGAVTWYQRGNQPLSLEDVHFTQIDPASSGPPAGFYQGASFFTPFDAAPPTR